MPPRRLSFVRFFWFASLSFFLWCEESRERFIRYRKRKITLIKPVEFTAPCGSICCNIYIFESAKNKTERLYYGCILFLLLWILEVVYIYFRSISYKIYALSFIEALCNLMFRVIKFSYTLYILAGAGLYLIFILLYKKYFIRLIYLCFNLN